MAQTLSHDSYAIGIICVLKEEKAAVDAMLDEEHHGLDKKRGDPNEYTFGKIGRHNVVVACLPAGQPGKVSAATVAIHMGYSFSIKLGLMVGIGGGVPSQVPDIRLGDVVVSMPEGTHGGVVQYDLGKLESDGFTRIGHLNNPPKALLSAITKLQGRHEWKDPDFPSYLSAITQNRKLATKYGYQGAEHDRLFLAGDVHPYGQKTCDQCISSLRVVERSPRYNDSPYVFYGTIGSGDIVMKNGEQRDSRAATDKISCFEMEAAGLMNDYECLVIRGISDYADSHKNDRWKPYAAATAAAYAKELLSVVSVQEVEKSGPASKHRVPFILKGIPVIGSFVQRDTDMQQLEAVFFSQQPSRTRRKIFVVYGLGGIGKTQLCVEFARLYNERYTAVFWLNGSSKDTLRSSFVDIAGRLPSDEVSADLVQTLKHAKPDIDLVVQSVHRWLSLPSNRQWLLIIDNVDRDHAARNNDIQAYNVAEYFPGGDHGNIMITSRLSNFQHPRLRLTKVNQKQALGILQGNLEDIQSVGESEAVNTLLSRLDGLPLAISQAGAFIRQTGKPVTEYLDCYDKTWKTLMEAHQFVLQEDSQRCVLTTWRMSYEQVQRQSQEAAELLKLWAFLDRNDLWYELVAKNRELRLEIEIPQCLLSIAESKLHFEITVELLTKYSLVELRADTNSYTMHSVLHEWCYYLSPSNGEKEVLRQLAIGIVAKMVPSENDKEYWKLQKRLFPHGRQVFPEVMEVKKRKDSEFFLALHQLAWLFASQRAYEEAEEMYERARKGYDEVLGPEHLSTLETTSNLGLLYADWNKLSKAEEMYQQALEGKEKRLGQEHISTLDTMNNLGLLYADQDKLTDAEEMYQRSLQGKEKILEPDHSSILDTLNNLGMLYDTQRKPIDAEKMYRRALEGKEKTLGPEHISTLDTVNNIGLLYADQDKPTDSEEMYQRALQGYKDAFGLEHTSTLRTMNNLGLLYADQDKPREAEHMYSQALEGYEKALGPDHSLTLDVVNNFGNLYADEDKPREAEKMYLRAVKGYEKALEPDHLSTLDTLNNLGLCYAGQGKRAEAEKMYQRAIEGYDRKGLGPEHPSRVRTVENLENLYNN